MRLVFGAGVLLAVLFPGVALGQSAAPLDRSTWRLHYVDSEERAAGDAAVNAFDGDPATKWATEWQAASPPPPHEIQIDLGQSHVVSGFRYLPRQDGQPHGNIARWEFYVSADGSSWGSAVATGTFPNTSSEQTVTFAGKTGRYVRLRALSEVNGRPWSVVAELNVLGGTSTPAPPPSGAISRSGWRLHYVDSEEHAAGDAAVNAFDGDPATKWATEWQAASPTPPHELQIDLGQSHVVSGFKYLPRQDGQPHGNIARWEFYVSADGSSWGSAVASGTFPNTGSEQTVTFAGKTGRYVRLRALSEVNGRPWSVVAELNVLGGTTTPAPPPSGAISHASWSLHHVDSQEAAAGDVAVNAFDGDPTTMWATEWQAASPPPPHEIQINLGASYSVTGFRYLPRQDGQPHGNIARWEFYVSADGSSWGSAVASGTFPNTGSEQTVTFAGKTGRYVRLRALSEVNGRPWSVVAELNVLGSSTGSGGGGNEAPVVSLTTAGTGPYLAPASVTFTAAASDSDGSVSRVDFYSGSTLVGSDTAAPYQLSLSGIPAGTHSFAAVARDNAGATTVSNTVTLTVTNAQMPTTAIFTPSADHDTSVERYVLEIFPAGADPALANSVAAMDVGKPAVVNGECSVAVGGFISALPPGTYFATLTAYGPGGSSRSAPSPQFSR